MTTPPRIQSILLALPTTGQSMKSGTAITVADIVKHLGARGVDVDMHNIDSAEIVTARDMFANMVLHSAKWQAVLFVDSDMEFDPRLIGRMLDQGGDVVGVACTRRNIDLEALVAARTAGEDMARARAAASEFNFKPGWDDGEIRLTIRNGFCRGAAVGFGVAFVTRHALEAMVEAGAVRPRLDLQAGDGRTCWSFFEPLEREGRRLGEDYAFCHRWTETLGRELWVCIDQEVQHIGSYGYRARYIDRLRVA